MKLTKAQLVELRSRCLKAAARGYHIGQVDKYLQTLSNETGITDVPKGVRKGSAEHLLYMTEAALEVRSGKRSKIDPVPEPVPEVVKGKKPKVKFESKPEPEPEPQPDVPPYEEWSYEDLYAEAKVRDIYGRSKMDKDELVQAMYKDDEG